MEMFVSNRDAVTALAQGCLVNGEDFLIAGRSASISNGHIVLNATITEIVFPKRVDGRMYVRTHNTLRTTRAVVEA